jgi:L-xylulokinase
MVRAASAGFFGLGGWHNRGDMLRAVLEGIAFNHRIHVDALRDGFSFSEARLAGGISRNKRVVQMFADVLGMPATVTETDEAAAWGAALCAGAGVGLYKSPRHDPRDTTRSRTDAIPTRRAAPSISNATISSGRSPTPWHRSGRRSASSPRPNQPR